MIIFWLFVTLSCLPICSCLLNILVILTRFRLPARPVAPTPLSLSMIVPIKGANPFLERNLEALVGSQLEGAVEYLFAMEDQEDPAFAVCERVKRQHPEQAIQIVLTGPAETRMGKQHNLSRAVPHTHYQVIGSVDADVMIAPDTLALALHYLTDPQTGIAYFLPRYVGPGPAGGLLVALYSNYYYQPSMGSVALMTNAPFITGSCWLIPRETLQSIGGLEQFCTTVSDDAAIGQAIVKQRLRTILVPATVSIPFEQLTLATGAQHLLKWLTMLRAEGIGTYLLILLTWHPIFWSAITVLIGAIAARGNLTVAIALLVGALLLKLFNAYGMNTYVYRFPGFHALLWLPIYELIAVPILFSLGLFRRTLVWRGRRYRISHHGVIQS